MAVGIITEGEGKKKSLRTKKKRKINKANRHNKKGKTKLNTDIFLMNYKKLVSSLRIN